MITIYTDGSCLTNPGNGGWAAIIDDGKEIKKISGNEKNTTNNRMELLAPINALKGMKPGVQIKIYTDSQYVKNGITEWINTWLGNNWKTSKKINFLELLISILPLMIILCMKLLYASMLFVLIIKRENSI